MGRAKLNMELINKEKSRHMTFKRRKDGLIKKMHEFTTLCDVAACMIIYGPKHGTGLAVEPEIWPDSPDEVRRIVDIYRSKSRGNGNDSSGSKTFGLSDFFHDRKKRIEDELAKLRRRNMEVRYPVRPDFMGFMSEAQLREFASGLRTKADYVKSRIEHLRRNKDGHDTNMDLMDFNNSPGPRGVELTILNRAVSAHVKPEMHHHHHVPIFNQNSMMMLLMNDNNHCMQFGPGPAGGGGGNIHCASYKRQVYYESLGRYYSPALPLPGPPPYMVGPGLAPQLQNNYGGEEDVINHDQYHMINQYNIARY